MPFSGTLAQRAQLLCAIYTQDIPLYIPQIEGLLVLLDPARIVLPALEFSALSLRPERSGTLLPIPTFFIGLGFWV